MQTLTLPHFVPSVLLLFCPFPLRSHPKHIMPCLSVAWPSFSIENVENYEEMERESGLDIEAEYPDKVIHEIDR